MRNFGYLVSHGQAFIPGLPGLNNTLRVISRKVHNVCWWHGHAQNSRGLLSDSPTGIYHKLHFPTTDNLTSISLLELMAQIVQLLVLDLLQSPFLLWTPLKAGSLPWHRYMDWNNISGTEFLSFRTPKTYQAVFRVWQSGVCWHRPPR